MNYTDSPTYLKSADLHNIGAGNVPMLDDSNTSTLESIANAPANLVKFSAVSLVSGVNSIYNTGITVANWFGADLKENDTAQTLASFDSDLGAYYNKNKEFADIAGFVATSFAPGLGGVKLFNTGQKMLSASLKTGTIGETLASSTGLIRNTDVYIAAASADLAKGTAGFNLMNANIIKTIGSGAQQAFWESAAFEISVAATMNQSPVLEKADFGDIASNVLTGALLGGAIGGVFNAATSYGKINTAMKAVDKENNPFRMISGDKSLIDPSNKILQLADDLGKAPMPTNQEQVTLLANRNTKINEQIRINVHALSGSDELLGNTIADSVHGMQSDQIANVMRGAEGFTRLSTPTAIKEGETLGYVKLHGENAGATSFEGPVGIPVLADRLPNAEAIDKFVDSAKFKEGREWKVVTASGSDEIQARYIWSETKAKYKSGMEIDKGDIPLLEGALKNNLDTITIKDAGYTYIVDRANMYNEVIQAKRELAVELGKARRAGWSGNKINKGSEIDGIITTDDISRAVNTSIDFLENTDGASAFLRRDLQNAHIESLKAKGVPITKANSNLDYIPQNVTVRYKTDSLADDVNAGMVEAMQFVKYQQKIQQESVDKAVIGAMGDELFNQVPKLTQRELIETNRQGAGAGLVTFANGGYGTAASKVEQMGAITARLTEKLQKETGEIMDSSMLKLRLDQVAAIKTYNIHQTAQAAGMPYVLNDAGDGLILRAIKEFRKGDVDTAPNIPTGVQEEILFGSESVANAIRGHMTSHTKRAKTNGEINQAFGKTDTVDHNAFYPIKADPKDYPFFAFVKDDTVTGAGAGHTSMLHAASEAELSALIEKVRTQTGYKVYTKKDTENFFAAQKEYDYGRTLHENYIDSGLRSKGIWSNPIPKTNPDAIVDEMMRYHQRQDGILSRNIMTAKNADEFDQLEKLGEAYTNVASSRFGGTTKNTKNVVQNPYADYARTALNISRLDEYPNLVSVNRALENGIGKVYKGIENAWKEGKGVNDLEKVNAALEQAGVSHAFKSAAEVLLANHTAPKPILSQFIRGANSILATTFLRTDPMNALNNAVGAQVLMGKETASLLRGINTRNPQLAGELSKLLDITVPGTQDAIKGPGKLIANAMQDFIRGNVDNDKFFKANGWLTSTSDMYRNMLTDLATEGTESGATLNAKLGAAMEKAKKLTEIAEKYTGNKLAEDFNRYTAAHIAKSLSDLGVQAGIMDSKTQLSYINTFVNRTQGNILASQRPLIFQGPIGQAIGLFQSFQFNTMQQLFRGVAESGVKDAAMMLGLQSTIYGLNGLPAFQFINQHIVGTASGNPEHKDAYNLTYGLLGKTAGDWLMYGVPSNLIQTNIYTRGDINPRNLTVIPTKPEDVIAVSAFAKFFGNLKETIGKVAGGGDIWQSILQGVEHNGLSRPLAGLAQSMQAFSSEGNKVFSTTNAGDVSFINDWWSLSTLSRIAGGKPLDEALANDEVSRSLIYKAKDRERMKAATEVFKSHIAGGEVPPAAATENYLEAFVRNGGDQKNFNQQMLNALTKTNTPKANQIIDSLKGPYGQHMQLMMGGKLDQFPGAPQ